MLKKIENFVAFGEINKPTLIRLIEKRARLIKKGNPGEKKDSKKINAEKIAEELEKKQELEKIGIKPFFRLHPPRRGLKSSKQKFPKGVLGNHKKEINKLIDRML